jgi:hypothetical protein
MASTPIGKQDEQDTLDKKLGFFKRAAVIRQDSLRYPPL